MEVFFKKEARPNAERESKNVKQLQVCTKLRTKRERKESK